VMFTNHAKAITLIVDIQNQSPQATYWTIENIQFYIDALLERFVKCVTTKFNFRVFHVFPECDAKDHSLVVF